MLVKLSERSSDLDLVPRPPSSAVKSFRAPSTAEAVAVARVFAVPDVATVVAPAATVFRTNLSPAPVPVLTSASTVWSANRLTPSKVAPARALVISAPRALKSAR
ncbi:hypothetical protein D3C80_1771450 [compost metagenome]